jgi:hypothetical protein
MGKLSITEIWPVFVDNKTFVGTIKRSENSLFGSITINNVKIFVCGDSEAIISKCLDEMSYLTLKNKIPKDKVKTGILFGKTYYYN